MSTGILEIDCQHQNLDTVLTLLNTASTDEAKRLLHTFSCGLADHFSFEERFTFEDGTDFVDSKHKQEHQEILAQVEACISTVDTNSLEISAVVINFSRALLSHALNFDIPASKQRNVSRD